MIHGFDVSQYQAGLSMAEARKAGMRFVFVRASDGAEADWACGEHMQGAQGVLARGTYHVLQPSIPAEDQAKTYYRSLAESGGFLAELPPAVNVQETGIDERLVRQFLHEMERLWQRTPLIYTSRNKWHRTVGPHRPWSNDYRLWVSDMNVEEPALPTPWNSCALWQFTAAQTPFWPRRVDLNVFHGNLQDLLKM